MRVAGFMSGSGTNISKILDLQHTLEKEKGVCPFETVFIFSDRSDGKCRGESIARNAGIPYFSYDIRQFHALRGEKRTVRTSKGMKLRLEYDRIASALIQTFDVDVVALGGYMSLHNSSPLRQRASRGFKHTGRKQEARFCGG